LTKFGPESRSYYPFFNLNLFSEGGCQNGESGTRCN
jgi:hypothetical protein